MKRFIIVMTAILLMIAMIACQPSTKPGKVKLATFADSLSYALGYVYGADVAGVDFNFDLQLIYKGLVNAQHEYTGVMTEDEIMNVLEKFTDGMITQRFQEDEQTRMKNKLAGISFMEENAKNPDVKTDVSGIQYKVLKSGKGKQVKDGDIITAHYAGKFLNGVEFDSSIKRGEPMTFGVDEVLPGWSAGLKLMREGDKFEIVIPDSLAYGDEAYDVIEPGSYLIFEVEILKVVK